MSFLVGVENITLEMVGGLTKAPSWRAEGVLLDKVVEIDGGFHELWAQ